MTGAISLSLRHSWSAILFPPLLLEVNFAEDIVKIVIASGTVALAIAFGVGRIDAAKGSRSLSAGLLGCLVINQG
jgi:hypothetical protein